MSSLISSEEKTSIQSVFDDLHDTFARDIYVYVKAKQTANWSQNPFYQTSNVSSDLSGEEKFDKFTYTARVQYKNDQNEDVFDASAQAGLSTSEGEVRIKVNNAAKEKIKNCSYIEIDNNLYLLDSDDKGIGPFSIQYYMFYLKRKN